MDALERYIISEYKNEHREDDYAASLSDEEILLINPPTSDDYKYFIETFLNQKENKDIKMDFIADLEETLKEKAFLESELERAKKTNYSSLTDLRSDIRNCIFKINEIEGMLKHLDRNDENQKQKEIFEMQKKMLELKIKEDNLNR